MTVRGDGRRPNQLRELSIRTDFLEQPHGSVLYGQGKTIVLCTATVEEGVPRWLYGSGRGWMTAEYSMLPASTGERTQRAVSRGRPDGRTVEIQRLEARPMEKPASGLQHGEQHGQARRVPAKHGAPRRPGRGRPTKAWISISSGSEPSMPANTAAPETPASRSARNRADGLGTSTRPRSAISDTPISFGGAEPVLDRTRIRN